MMAEKRILKAVNVFPLGTRVRVTSVDMHGHCGRSAHPSPEDVGFEGTIVDALVEIYHDDGSCDTITRENVPPILELYPGSEAGVCYEVLRGGDGKVLELMDHEVEPVDEDTMATRRFALELVNRHLGHALEAMEDLTDSEHYFFCDTAGALMEKLEEACLLSSQTAKKV